MLKKYGIWFFAVSVGLFLLPYQLNANNTANSYQKILYINSYAVTYSWGDSVARGIVSNFRNKENITLYVEYLDSKRFGTSLFENYYALLSEKYRNTRFDVIITSDNNALDFMLLYGDSLAPNVPVVFCGINNPEDYSLENNRYFGIKEGVDLDSVIKLAIRVIPDIKKIYFICDSSSTGLVNLEYAQKLEPFYKNKVEFEYITNVSIDSLHYLVNYFEKGNAICLHDIFKDKNGQPVNPDLVMEKTARLASVPIFMDSETSFGRGILGGILNSGYEHGLEAAGLSEKFLESSNFTPKNRVSKAKDNYYFDYAILKKYHLNPNLLPKSAHIINKPKNIFIKYLNYFIYSFIVIIILLIIISFLVINITKRKKAESDLNEKIKEVQQQNIKLEEANVLMNSMNEKLEKFNENLKFANKELEIAKQKSEESDRLKSSFLANMSHEIRTPLNAIVGFSALFKEEDVDLNERQRFAELIEINSENLLKLIDDILDISKTEAGQLKINYSLISVHKVFYEIIESFKSNLKNPDIELRLARDCAENDICLNTDSLRFKQVVSNLISNALKFTRSGFIEIGFQTVYSDLMTFYVSDSGTGIEKEDLQKIFDRFWKIEEKDGLFNPGTGLGLSISRKICELLGGSMWAESVPGKGSTFYFTHPAGLPPPEEISTSTVPMVETEIDYEKLKGLTIAIVEDELNNLELLSKILVKYGIRIKEFKNGKEIVDYLSFPEQPLDLILMDIKMPVMNGYEATSVIKSNFPEMIVIAQSAYALKEDKDKAGNAKFDNYVTKPIKIEELLKTIIVCLENKETNKNI